MTKLLEAIDRALDRRPWTWLIALFLVALGLRLGFAIATGWDRPPEPGSDEWEYDCYAWSLAQGRGYRGPSADVSDPDHLTAFRTPGTSMVWAAPFRLFGHRYEPIRIIHCVVSAFAVVLTYPIARRCLNRPASALASAIHAFAPTSIFYAADLVSEPLAVFWFFLYLWGCLRLFESPSWRMAILSGLFLGATILTRPSFGLMLPFTVVWGLYLFWPSHRKIAQGVAVVAVAAACLAPWMIRNAILFGAPVLSTLEGSTFLAGNNRLVVTDPLLYGYCIWDSQIPEYAEALKADDNEYLRNQRARRLAIEWLMSHKDKWGFLAWHKTRRSWTPFLQPHTPKIQQLAMALYWGPLLILFLIGLIPSLRAWLRDRHPGLILHLAILHFQILTLIYFGYLRYRYPLEPLCVIVGLHGSGLVGSWLMNRRRTAPHVVD